MVHELLVTWGLMNLCYSVRKWSLSTLNPGDIDAVWMDLKQNKTPELLILKLTQVYFPMNGVSFPGSEPQEEISRYVRIFDR